MGSRGVSRAEVSAGWTLAFELHCGSHRREGRGGRRGERGGDHREIRSRTHRRTARQLVRVPRPAPRAVWRPDHVRRPSQALAIRKRGPRRVRAIARRAWGNLRRQTFQGSLRCRGRHGFRARNKNQNKRRRNLVDGDDGVHEGRLPSFSNGTLRALSRTSTATRCSCWVRRRSESR